MKKEYKEYTFELCKTLKRIMGLSYYSMDVAWSDEDVRVRRDNKERGVSAEIDINDSYLNFLITIHPMVYDLYKKKKYYEIVEVLCHELCHVFTEPLYTVAVDSVTNTSQKFLENIKEQQTQKICNAILGLLDEKDYYPSKLLKKKL